ncbi:hypothetical protein JG687_00017720 [Phytophthora cactorum]|uniref:Uncharacterized protein n=1 Tax=Phytophthora cactorum TaxID=29920 RepID=A0A8T1TPB3_9STRA|nr:hypothetical protein JG687_00017720 [Phytophthora cactorum]
MGSKICSLKLLKQRLQSLTGALITTAALLHYGIPDSIAHVPTYFHTLDPVNLFNERFPTHVWVAQRCSASLAHASALFSCRLGEACTTVVLCIKRADEIVACRGTLRPKHTNFKRVLDFAGAYVHVCCAPRQLHVSQGLLAYEREILYV